MSKPLANQVALVTGGSRGIGAAIATKLAADGAHIAITYTSSKPKADELVASITKAGGKALAIQADSADEAAVRRAVNETAKHFGKLDILVNNAGVADGKPLADFSLEAFDRIFDINVRGLFVATQEAAKHLKAGGRIINIGSTVSERTPGPGSAVYVSSKSAVVGLTKALAQELAPRGITVNNVQPGPVDTDLNPAKGPNAEGLIAKTPAGRYGHVDEIASVVAFVASPAASYMTGAQILVDGGFAA